MSNAPVLDPINVVGDAGATSEYEQKHAPDLEVAREGGSVMVRVRVGRMTSHPNLPDHHIEWIALSVGGSVIARAELSAVVAAPDVTWRVELDPGTPLRATASCNLHGLWAADTLA